MSAAESTPPPSLGDVITEMHHLLYLLPDAEYRCVTCTYQRHGKMFSWTFSDVDQPEEDE